jgi:hypothetical protein
MDDYNMVDDEYIPKTPSCAKRASADPTSYSPVHIKDKKSIRFKVQDLPNYELILGILEGPAWKNYMTCPLVNLIDDDPSIECCIEETPRHPAIDIDSVFVIDTLANPPESNHLMKSKPESPDPQEFTGPAAVISIPSHELSVG